MKRIVLLFVPILFLVAFLSINASGQLPSSGPPEINVWYGPDQRFGHLGIPQRWVNILGKVSDPDGIQSLTYSLNGQPQRALFMGPYWFRLYGEGDFNIDILYSNLVPGPNNIVITAVDSLGHTAVKTVTVDHFSGNTWKLPYAIDWANTLKIQDAAQVVEDRKSVV